MVYRILEIYRISSLVILLPMVKEPVGAIWPEWRGLLIPDLISGRKKENPNFQVPGHVLFALLPK